MVVSDARDEDDQQLIIVGLTDDELKGLVASRDNGLSGDYLDIKNFRILIISGTSDEDLIQRIQQLIPGAKLSGHRH